MCNKKKMKLREVPIGGIFEVVNGSGLLRVKISQQITNSNCGSNEVDDFVRGRNNNHLFSDSIEVEFFGLVLASQ